MCEWAAGERAVGEWVRGAALGGVVVWVVLFLWSVDCSKLLRE